MQSYMGPVFRHTKLWLCFIAQEKYSHFTEKSELWALKFMQPKIFSMICQIIHHIISGVHVIINFPYKVSTASGK